MFFHRVLSRPLCPEEICQFVEGLGMPRLDKAARQPLPQLSFFLLATSFSTHLTLGHEPLKPSSILEPQLIDPSSSDPSNVPVDVTTFFKRTLFDVRSHQLLYRFSHLRLSLCRTMSRSRTDSSLAPLSFSAAKCAYSLAMHGEHSPPSVPESLAPRSLPPQSCA